MFSLDFGTDGGSADNVGFSKELIMDEDGLECSDETGERKGTVQDTSYTLHLSLLVFKHLVHKM